MLELFACGLAGRQFRIAEGDSAHTDSETFFLSASLETYPKKDDNFLLYKGMVAHLSWRLGQVEARVRLLITLSNGKPDDFHDQYRGTYGIEDTRMALLEAKRAGIHPYCITIDKEGPQYLPHMYGAVNYAVIDDIKRLPLKIADIYRKLTT